MPILSAAIDPVTRIEGHLKIDIQVDTINGVQQVIEARAIGTLFRAFERVLVPRDPRDAPIITSRICGVCPTSHAMAAALTLDHAFGVTPPDAARILRNLVHAACYLESHILHFYLLSLPDFIQGPGMAPWLPGLDVGRRLDKDTTNILVGNYLAAITMRRKCHEMGAIWGGKLPHTPAYIAGGFTAVAHAEDKASYQALLTELGDFINGTYLPDVERLASLYPDYFSIGRGYGHLMSYGVFEEDNAGDKLFQAGRVVGPHGTSVQALDASRISEHVTHSWYEDRTNDRHPAVGETAPQHPKPGAYSWLKAPRYDGVPYECGPLARMVINGEYPYSVSVLDRIRSRAQEASKLVQAMQGWLDELPLNTPAYTPNEVPFSASGEGLTEAPRGALGHWMDVAGGKIARYQVITPTCWTISPQDSTGQRGPLEQALIGTPIANPDQPVEALRVIHSVDPCLDCATHVSRPGKNAKVFQAGVAVP